MDINSIDTSTLAFSVGFDIIDAGRHPDDGSLLTGEAYFVEARTEQGSKWRRDVGTWKPDFSGYYDYDTDDDVTVPQVPTQEQVAQAAAGLAHRLNSKAKPHLDTEVWDFAGHVYGSELWDQQDECGLMDEEELTAYWSRQ